MKNIMETMLLDMTLTKVGGLLALGFGEAGSEIIAQNILNRSEINTMAPGNKVICIFGYCDIHHF
jgi:hypothetical protein